MVNCLSSSKTLSLIEAMFMQLAPALCRVGNPVWTCLRASDGHTDRQTHTQAAIYRTGFHARLCHEAAAAQGWPLHGSTSTGLSRTSQLCSFNLWPLGRWQTTRRVRWPPPHEREHYRTERERERLNHQRFSFSIHKRLQYSVCH